MIFPTLVIFSKGKWTTELLMVFRIKKTEHLLDDTPVHTIANKHCTTSSEPFHGKVTHFAFCITCSAKCAKTEVWELIFYKHNDEVLSHWPQGAEKQFIIVFNSNLKIPIFFSETFCFNMCFWNANVGSQSDRRSIGNYQLFKQTVALNQRGKNKNHTQQRHHFQ